MAFVIFFLNHIKKALNYLDLRKSLCWWNQWFKNTNNSSFLPLKLSVKKSQNTGNSLLLKRKILNEGHWNTIKLLTKSLTLFGNGEKKLVCIFLSFTASSQCSQHFYQTFIEPISSLKLEIEIWKKSKDPNYWNFIDHSKNTENEQVWQTDSCSHSGFPEYTCKIDQAVKHISF